ncbi:SufD family Fe-S cluster assembly protein [Chlamydiifrater phoenicopteri]|uniref:SufD family Fe-S cluster assembly protein n=1 Tax=Chlamydiifrater phoenicopteri TaxID=2681469 RepID=UPI001BD079F5|nr:SufD family Fe-S cluster assembly protein [Chlamydiifrater phoenicopteri]
MTQVLSLFKNPLERRVLGGAPYEENEEYRNCLQKATWLKISEDSGDNRCFAFSKEGELQELIQQGMLSLDSGWNCTFVNGVFEPRLSSVPEGCFLLSVKDARRFYQSFFQLHKEGLENKKSPLHGLNASFLDEAAFLYVPEDFKIQDPISIRNIVTKSFACTDRSAILPAVTVAVASRAFVEVNVLPCEFFSGEGIPSSASTEGIFSGVLNIVAEDYATIRLNFGAEALLESPSIASGRSFWEEESQAWSVSALMQERSSILTRIYSRKKFFSSGIVDCRYQLLSPYAYSEVLGSIKDPEGLLLKVAMIHKAEKTGSRQTIKSLLNEDANFSFEGDIIIEPDCGDSEAYQKHDSLLMGESASVLTIPRLQIFTDNVKASHGATVGRPDDGIIFFMRSRGISEERAKEIFLKGFLYPEPEGFIFD